MVRVCSSSLDRLITIAMPPFATSGIAGKFDGRATTTRWRERADHLPEIEYDKIDACAG